MCFVYKVAAEIGELGDNTAALRDAIRADDVLRAALDGAGRPGHRPRPHPLGERRRHLRGQRPPAQQRRPTAGPRTCRRHQRRRRQLPRAAGRRRADRSPPEITDGREGPPGSWSPRGWRPATRRRGLRRPPSPAARARPRSPRASRAAPDSAAPRAARQRPVALRRPRAGRVRRRLRALRRRPGDAAATCRWRARAPPHRVRSSCSTAPAPASSTGVRRLAYDGTVQAGRRGQRQARRDHRARHRPRRLPALPAQGDLARRRARSEDAARQDRRRRWAPHRPARPRHAAGRRGPRRPAPGAIRRIVVDRPGHRGGGRPQRRHGARTDAGSSTGPGGSRCSPRSCRASASPTTCRDTLVVAVSQSGTTTDTNRTVDLRPRPRGRRRRDRQPPQLRPRRARPTACSTPRTAATWR